MEKLGLLFDARQFALVFGAVTQVSNAPVTRAGPAAPGPTNDGAAAEQVTGTVAVSGPSLPTDGSSENPKRDKNR
jgi:hypothetical protein